jgi:hypothetical protein
VRVEKRRERSNELTDAELRRLAETTADEETVLSVFVDLDPRTFAQPRGRQSEIDSLLDGAHREIESGEHSHAQLLALRAPLSRVRASCSRRTATGRRTPVRTRCFCVSRCSSSAGCASLIRSPTRL